jgi:hypothetical protein
MDAFISRQGTRRWTALRTLGWLEKAQTNLYPEYFDVASITHEHWIPPGLEGFDQGVSNTKRPRLQGRRNLHIKGPLTATGEGHATLIQDGMTQRLPRLHDIGMGIGQPLCHAYPVARQLLIFDDRLQPGINRLDGGHFGWWCRHWSVMP